MKEESDAFIQQGEKERQLRALLVKKKAKKSRYPWDGSFYDYGDTDY